MSCLLTPSDKEAVEGDRSLMQYATKNLRENFRRRAHESVMSHEDMLTFTKEKVPLSTHAHHLLSTSAASTPPHPHHYSPSPPPLLPLTPTTAITTAIIMPDARTFCRA